MRERLIAQLRETGEYIVENCGEDRYGLLEAAYALERDAEQIAAYKEMQADSGYQIKLLEREVARLSAELEWQKRAPAGAANSRRAQGKDRNRLSIL
ncbi:hypothetical protein H8711_05985 [Clostridiaceae bacterium NSJ-31]|uniref:Uncharacterized protein n=1 Tax=Ligaoa zhengdingensis TaxID=2763658 RepID=A0A926I4G4_9FIRM|nr:hypothetical protein [Ligaoa zhengdingensis]MBC8546483.1 hypothetical protein [Ligaoa zhengdingensis]